MLNSHSQCQFAVVGAGPYGLAVGAHLRARGLDVRIFGNGVIALRWKHWSG